MDCISDECMNCCFIILHEKINFFETIFFSFFLCKLNVSDLILVCILRWSDQWTYTHFSVRFSVMWCGDITELRFFLLKLNIRANIEQNLINDKLDIEKKVALYQSSGLGFLVFLLVSFGHFQRNLRSNGQ